jgi:coenzyme Q-binding protein COQ10
LRTHRLTRRSPHTAEQMFALVGDVERYPEFVPWVTSLTAFNPTVLEDGRNTIDAEASVGFAIFRERFATRVYRNPPDRLVSVSLLSGPFRSLSNEWRFVDRPEGGCDIHFFIEFEFRSRLLEALLDANFDRAVSRLIACFEARADQLYGASSPAP